MEKIWLKSWPAGVPKQLNYINEPIFRVLSGHARLAPGRVAVNYYGRAITYGELDRLTDCFAASLVELGIRKGDRVSLYMENCPQLIIAMIGGWKAGAVMVPSNPMFLGDELVYQLVDAGVETIVLQDDIYPVFEAVKKRTPVENVIVTGRKDFLPGTPTLPPHHTLLTAPIDAPGALPFKDMLSGKKTGFTGMEPGMDDLALLMYTAGTTGMPKGAMISHRNLISNTAGSAAWVDGCPGDIHLAVLPLFEVTGLVHSMAMPLYTGGTIILLARFETETVLEAVERYRCTHWAGIATMSIAVVNYPNVAGWDLTSLRYCLTNGSPEVMKFFRQLTGAKLINGYGLSETISQVTLVPPEKPRTGSVGIPVQETDIKIVDIDDRERELPPGEEGELMVKGPQVMQGYWNRPGETRRALRDGWLATGDVACVDEDGYVYIVGRKKELIKPSGFIIFPQEVENFLYEHPAVAEAVVVGIPDPYRIETVKAYIVLRQEYAGKISEQDIIEWSRRKMAAYKYPRVVEFVPELPHNGNGKVNRCFVADMNKSCYGLNRNPGGIKEEFDC
ncbi:AMP-binding protein [Desulfallas sp. Bu1-1]|uniref:AMP-binding protein n=1 Tax=Desulfallas sp. Bu1-1 TaxID=2787620 RepID=UPI00189E5ADE|nr:AMP-binding protein [Desulfallas sp. Bu1-1]MBF7082713.1 AMP-binding protein [Desulfallas sp. Bu1-1]